MSGVRADVDLDVGRGEDDVAVDVGHHGLFQGHDLALLLTHRDGQPEPILGAGQARAVEVGLARDPDQLPGPGVKVVMLVSLESWPS